MTTLAWFTISEKLASPSTKPRGPLGLQPSATLQVEPKLSNLPKHSVSVAGVVVDSSDRVLVIRRRNNGEWQPQGGVLELSESLEEGVRREVAEETGAHVEVEQLTGLYKNLGRGVVALVFRCRPTSSAATRTDEASEIR